MQSPNNNRIAVFDSGFGGLTVLKELQKTLPHEQFIYFGDTARLPYGTKSRETIIRYTAQNCAFLAQQDVKMIVIACNTATSMAMDSISLSIPVVGVIDPVLQFISSRRIGILGTRATVSSGVYQRKIQALIPDAERSVRCNPAPSGAGQGELSVQETKGDDGRLVSLNRRRISPVDGGVLQITAIPAPLLVSLVEEGFIDHPMTHLAIQEYTRPLLLAKVDTVILACTHFPLLKDLIEKALGPTIQIIDPAFATAKAVQQKLIDLNQLSGEKTGDSIYYVTDDPEKFERLGPQFLGQNIRNVKSVEIEMFVQGQSQAL